VTHSDNSKRTLNPFLGKLANTVRGIGDTRLL
jgi:hypothetical protein